VWQISKIQPQQGRCILNFYGPPGTGKTRAALGVALRLGKPLYQVDYSAVISKFLGDTAKHIKLAFAQARENDAVLFFDEADSLLSKRVATGESCSTMRRELFALHLPNHGRVEANFEVLAWLSRGLSGGDILNIALNAIHAGSVDADSAEWKITQAMLEREIEKARAAREEHEGKRRRGKRVIGFHEPRSNAIVSR